MNTVQKVIKVKVGLLELSINKPLTFLVRSLGSTKNNASAIEGRFRGAAQDAMMQTRPGSRFIREPTMLEPAQDQGLGLLPDSGQPFLGSSTNSKQWH